MAPIDHPSVLRSWRGIAFLLTTMSVCFSGCGDDTGPTGGGAPTGGTGGTGGSTGTGGIAGVGGASADTFDLTFTGEGYGIHTSQRMYFALFRDSDDTAPVATATLDVASDEITQTLPDVFVLFSGETYTLYYYADINGNEVCEDGEGADHYWSIDILEPSGDTTITSNHSLTFDGDCSKHNL
ncbi:MAG: hypothetical protein WBG86_17400 [Polyangiales bacterium]